MKRFRMWMLIGVFTFAAVVSAQDVAIEDSGSLPVGEIVSGELEVGARDRYTLDVGDNTVLNIFLDGTGEMDTYLRVYREGESDPFAENDDRGDGSLYSAVEAISVTPGEVLAIEAGTYADEGEGTYTLRAALPATIEDAGAITIGESITASFPENTRLRYTLTAEETTAFRVLLEGTDDLDTYLRLYLEGEDTPAVQSNEIEPGNVAAGFTQLIVPGGTSLIIEAATASDAGSGEFTLTVEEVDINVADAVEPIEWTEDSTPDSICEDANSTAEPERLQYLAPEEVLESGVDYGAVFCTEAGSWRVDLYETEAPIATNSFVYLAEHGFFDNTTFHRVIEDFVVQGGDPLGAGYGGPGYEFVNETDNELTFGGIGVLGMANAGPDTNGSQFFITLAPVARLDGGYTIFGQVEEGMGSVFDVEVRDPSTAVEPGTTIYTIRIITVPPQE